MTGKLQIAAGEGEDCGEGFAGCETKREGEAADEAAERMQLAPEAAGGEFLIAGCGIMPEISPFIDDSQQWCGRDVFVSEYRIGHIEFLSQERKEQAVPSQRTCTLKDLPQLDGIK